MSPAGFPHRLARSLVRLAARRVPPTLRDRFVREWDGELAGGEGTGWESVTAALGAFADAGTLRRIDRNREGTMAGWTEGFATDLAVAARGMRRAPGFTVVAVATLALGLGGSAAIFTLLDRVVLSPLPYPDPERLVRLENQVPGVGPAEVWSLSTAQWVHFTDHASTLESVGLYRFGGGNVMTASGPQRVRSMGVTPSMMDLLGARASLGRVLAPADGEPGAPRVALLSRGFWRRVMGSDPSVVGTTLTYDGNPVEVVGVLASDPELPGLPSDLAPDVWFAMQVDRGGRFFNNHAFPGVARLAEGATPEAAEREILALTARLPEAFPDAYSQAFFDRYGFRTRVTPLKESVVGPLADKLWILFGGVGLVLLIACANVANLFVVRMEGRRREMDVRAALGASRGALGRYVLAESMTLALAGAALALLVAYWALPALVALAPADVPRVHGASLGWTTAGFTVSLAVAVGLALAAWPFLSSRGRRGSLAGEARGATAGARRQRLRGAMVVGQVALALSLVVGAGLLLQALSSLRRADAGVDPEGVVAVDLYLSHQRHRTQDDVWNAYDAILERVRALPGVASAGMSGELPVSGGFGCTVQGFEDATVYDLVKEQGRTTCAGQQPTSPGFLETLGIPLLEGRTLTQADMDDPSRRAVVVSRAFAERFWPGRSALGQGVAPSGNTEGPFYHVVGVVGDVARAASEGEVPLSQPAIALYYPMRLGPDDRWNRNWWPGAVSLVVRSELDDPSSLFPAIRRAVADVDPEIPVTNATSMEAVVAGATAQLAFVSLLLAIAAGTALLLATVGLYGVLSYVVGQRTREIGMRMAVGAQPGDVRGMVVRGAMVLVAWGLAAGTGLALLARRTLEPVLAGAAPAGALPFVASALLLAGVALGASWIPAWRASRVDPVVALRAD
ncbi:MAG: hypothetical protein AMXMBFR53_33810 [Gemmatimonadota bacterium]